MSELCNVFVTPATQPATVTIFERQDDGSIGWRSLPVVAWESVVHLAELPGGLLEPNDAILAARPICPEELCDEDPGTVWCVQVGDGPFIFVGRVAVGSAEDAGKFARACIESQAAAAESSSPVRRTLQ